MRGNNSIKTQIPVTPKRNQNKNTPLSYLLREHEQTTSQSATNKNRSLSGSSSNRASISPEVFSPRRASIAIPRSSRREWREKPHETNNGGCGGKQRGGQRVTLVGTHRDVFGRLRRGSGTVGEVAVVESTGQLSAPARLPRLRSRREFPL